MAKSGANSLTRQFGKPLQGMVLYNYAQTPRAKLYPTLQMAMEACIKLKKAKGITFEPDWKAHTLRATTNPCTSRIPAEISWLQE